METLEKLKGQFGGKKVLVVGLGLLGGGVGIAKFFAKIGAQVTVSDLKTEEQLEASLAKLKGLPITFKLHQQNIDDFLNADIIFKAPKMRWDAPEIIAAQKKGIPVDMEVSFFLRNCPAQVIGVTGTRGKSTTTSMIHDILKKSLPQPAYVAGNLPNTSTISLLETVKKSDNVVLEISSWQLSAMHRHKISPHIAVFTSFYPDHLDYYCDLDEYLYDKKAIYMYQKREDFLILSKQVKGVLKNEIFISQIFEYSASDFPVRLEHLRGEHNRENAAAALRVAQILKIDIGKAAAILSSFAGLPDRLQPIRRINDVTFINDTTSTTPTATVKAIEAMDDKPIILILGGNAKNLPYEELFKSLDKVAYIVLLQGTFTNEILERLEGRFAAKMTQPYEDLREAVRIAYDKAREIGDTYVLFSPAATSFSMFNNEFHRGAEYDRIVAEF